MCKVRYNVIREKFPETEFISVNEGHENPNDLWMNITAPADEDREDELIEFVGDKDTDILIDYGYYILAMPIKKLKRYRWYEISGNLCLIPNR